MSNQKSRKQFVNLVLIIYWITILEGVARKWILPDLSNVLFFMKDPVVLLTYGLVLKNGMRPIKSSFLSVAVLFAVGALALTLIELAIGLPGMSLLLAAYGFRNYFLFLPLAFLIPKYFTSYDIDRMIRHTLLMAVPMAVLVFFQFSSPNSAAVNIGAGRELSTFGFGSTVSFVRPYGTFSSPMGLGAFIVTALAMLIVVFFRPPSERPVGRAALMASTASIFACLVFCGSRGTMIMSAIVILLSMSALIVTPRFQLVMRAAAILFVLLPMGFAAALAFAPEAVLAFSERWTGANETESEGGGHGVWGRALSQPSGVIYLVPALPALGLGLGSGGNAASAESSSALFSEIKSHVQLVLAEAGVAAESDWEKHLLDLGPVLGVAFVAYRIAFTISLARAAFRAARVSRSPIPVAFFGFSGTLLFSGNIVGQGDLQAYGWIFVGLTMAVRSSYPKKKIPVVPGAMPPLPSRRTTALPEPLTAPL